MLPLHFRERSSCGLLLVREWVQAGRPALQSPSRYAGREGSGHRSVLRRFAPRQRPRKQTSQQRRKAAAVRERSEPGQGKRPAHIRRVRQRHAWDLQKVCQRHHLEPPGCCECWLICTWPMNADDSMSSRSGF